MMKNIVNPENAGEKKFVRSLGMKPKEVLFILREPFIIYSSYWPFLLLF